MSNIRTLFLALLLFGCASNNTQEVALVVDNNLNAEQKPDQVSKNPYKTAQSDKNKVVCSYVKETGTHFKTRVCKTVAQINAEREQALRDHGDALSCAFGSNTE